MTPITHDDTSPGTSRGHTLFRLTTIAVAAALGLAIWLIAAIALRVPMVVETPAVTQTVGPVTVLTATLIPGAAAWGLLAILERRGAGGVRAWRITAWIVFALSLLGPITAVAPAPTKAALLTMHTLVGITLLVGLPLVRRPGESPRSGPDAGTISSEA